MEGYKITGILPRSFDFIFNERNKLLEKEHTTIRISCTFIEIYGDDLKDLFNPYSQKKIQIRETGKKEIFFSELKDIEVENVDELYFLLLKGSKNRCTGSTAANNVSSRSHSIFTLYFDHYSSKSDGSDGNRYFSKFHFVDLAGSERQKITKNIGTRFLESISINKGLLALGSVINALTDKKRKLK